MSKISITWLGDVTSISGPAQYARSLIKALIEAGVSIRLEPLQSNLPQADLDEWWIKTIQHMAQNQPGYVKICHCNPVQGTPNVFGGPNILLAHWDTLEIPRSWVSVINSKYTHLWSTTVTANDYLEKAGIAIPTSYLRVPIAIKPDTEAADIVDINPSTIVFGSTGYWDQRSNFSDLIISYISEFVPEDNVALVLKTGTTEYTDPNKRAAVLNMVREIKKQVNKPNHPPVIVLQDVFTQDAMDSIIKRFDVYVTTERGASTNITMGKALAMGKPVIGTKTDLANDYAHLLSDKNSMLSLVSNTIEPVYGFPNGNPLDRWIKPDLDGLIKHMRRAYINVRLRNKNVADAAEVSKMITERYDAAKIAAKLMITLGSMQKKPTVQLV